MKKLIYVTGGRPGQGEPRTMEVEFLNLLGQRRLRVTVEDENLGQKATLVLNEDHMAELGDALLADLDFVRARRNRR